MPHNHPALTGLTVLPMTQPVGGGVARVVTDLVCARVRGGARVVVACPGDTAGAPDSPATGLPHAAAAAGAEVVRWPARRSPVPGPRLAREIAAARRLIRATRPGLLHLHSAMAGLAGRRAARNALHRLPPCRHGLRGGAHRGVDGRTDAGPVVAGPLLAVLLLAHRQAGLYHPGIAPSALANCPRSPPVPRSPGVPPPQGRPRPVRPPRSPGPPC